MDEALERGAESRGMEINRLRVVRKWQLDHLVGKILDYMEATFSDKEQRDAHKKIVKNIIYPWFEEYCWVEGIGDVELTDAVSELIKKMQGEIKEAYKTTTWSGNEKDLKFITTNGK